MVELGMYHKQLMRYAKYFNDEQIQIFLFRDFIENTRDVVRRLFDFIGVNPNLEVGTNERHNESSRLTNARLYQVLYRAWSPVKSVLPEMALERLFGLRSTVRSFFFRSGEETKPSLKVADQKYLSDLYDQPNARLEAWLEHDLSHWT